MAGGGDGSGIYGALPSENCTVKRGKELGSVFIRLTGAGVEGGGLEAANRSDRSGLRTMGRMAWMLRLLLC